MSRDSFDTRKFWSHSTLLATEGHVLGDMSMKFAKDNIEEEMCSGLKLTCYLKRSDYIYVLPFVIFLALVLPSRTCFHIHYP